MDTEAAVVAEEAPFELDPLPTRCVRLARLEVVMATILTNQAQILKCLNYIQLTLDKDVASDTPAAPAHDADETKFSFFMLLFLSLLFYLLDMCTQKGFTFRELSFCFVLIM